MVTVDRVAAAIGADYLSAMIVIGTLGDLREGGYRLFAHCEVDGTCLHSGLLDIDVC